MIMKMWRRFMAWLPEGDNRSNGSSSHSAVSGIRVSIWREAEQTAWCSLPAQKRFIDMMRALPPAVAKRLTRMMYMDSLGNFASPSPDTPDALYRRIESLLIGAGIGYGRGGQSREDYVATLKDYLELYYTSVDGLGQTASFKRDTFDNFLTG